MRILIAPDMSLSRTGGAGYLSVNLTDLLLNEGNEVSLCASSSFSYARAIRYPAPSPFRHCFSSIPHTKEEYLYGKGALDSFYLKKDLQALLNALKESRAQLLLEAGRPAAVIAARTAHIPVWSFVHPSLYHTRAFPGRYLRALNAILRNHYLEQILRLSDLYAYADKRFVFGPASVSSLPSNVEASRIGMMSLPPVEVQPSERLCIYLSETFQGNLKETEAVLKEAFQGAGYEVNLWYPGIHHGKEDNIRKLPAERFNLINGARICIHDGDSAVFNACLACGTRQLVINDGYEERSWNASAAERSGAGLALNINDLSMEKLYSTYRGVLSDDYFIEHAQDLKKEALQLGSISEIAEMIRLPSC